MTSLLLCSANTWSQDVGAFSSNPPDSALGTSATHATGNKTSKVPNPFDTKADAASAMAQMGMEMDDMGSSEYADGGMGGMEMMMGASPRPTPDQVFRSGLQRAIEALKKSKSDQEKQTLRGYIRTAFKGRYDQQIVNRKRDLDRLKRSVAQLEGDLQRREAAKDRVVELQLQSVQLAAEGLLDLNEFQNSASGASSSGRTNAPGGSAGLNGSGFDGGFGGRAR